MFAFASLCYSSTTKRTKVIWWQILIFMFDWMLYFIFIQASYFPIVNVYLLLGATDDMANAYSDLLFHIFCSAYKVSLWHLFIFWKCVHLLRLLKLESTIRLNAELQMNSTCDTSALSVITFGSTLVLKLKQSCSWGKCNGYNVKTFSCFMIRLTGGEKSSDTLMVV